ncbi:MAG: ribosomal RNA small subunit methyltransferase H [Candidatus Hydrogenedentota bacterium]
MHVPVLAGPAIEWLRIREDGVYVDCTAGAGGHAELIVRRLTKGKLIALDRDIEAVGLTRERLAGYAQAVVIHANYSRLASVVEELGIAHVDGVLIDAGLSSAQLDDASRGFSFQLEGPLDMRMDTSQGLTAAEYLGSVSEDELARALKVYGDVRPARRIARSIVGRRRSRPIRTTTDLREAVKEALPFVGREPEEIRTVFQSIRIVVNDECRALERGLRQAVDLLAPGGRLVAIAFHSGEDRIVKNVIREESRPHRELTPDGRVRSQRPARLKVLTPKPISPDHDETAANPRSHSARLRAAERIREREGAG